MPEKTPNELYAEVMNQTSQIVEAWGQTLKLMASALNSVADALLSGVRSAYKAAGEPLGPGDAAMSRWLHIEADD